MSNRAFPERGIPWKRLEKELWSARAGDEVRSGRRAAAGGESTYA